MCDTITQGSALGTCTEGLVVVAVVVRRSIVFLYDTPAGTLPGRCEAQCLMRLWKTAYSKHLSSARTQVRIALDTASFVE